jgi:hypothetical protein
MDYFKITFNIKFKNRIKAIFKLITFPTAITFISKLSYS